ncbi:putative reverse transcriptase domain-containing protein [Tanacetum coccineum]
MASRRGTKTKTTLATATATTTTTTPMTDATIRELIAQGVANALAWRPIQRNTNLNDDGSQCSGSGITRLVHPIFKNQVKFATCTLHGNALTWWNTHVKTVGHDAAYGTSIDVRWMFPEESDVVEKYAGGLLDIIYGNVMSTKPKTMKEAVEMANNLMDQKLRTCAECQNENKRKQDDNSRNNQNQQQSNKRQNTNRAYTAGTSEKREYSGSLPKCSKCNYHHNGLCAPKCHNCNKVGHLAWDCRSSSNANTCNNQRATGANQKGTGCYECGAQGKRDCPKLKNKNRGTGNAPAKVYVVGNVGINPNSNVITGTFLLNNSYASILFDTGTDRSFVSTTFSSLIDITPTTLDHYYDVELADRKIIRINTIIWGYTLNFLNHPFNIDLMPVELGSFDVIIGMDWLAKYHDFIICDEKLVRIP